MFGVTKNVIIGQAFRRGWKAHQFAKLKRRPRTTLYQRMDALDAKLDQVLAETQADVEADRVRRAAKAQRKAA
jgi:hypothetical protein